MQIIEDMIWRYVLNELQLKVRFVPFHGVIVNISLKWKFDWNDNYCFEIEERLIYINGILEIVGRNIM